MPHSPEIRTFTDSDAPEVTALLHRAYGELAARGLNFTAATQDEATTRHRAAGGVSWVLVAEGRIVATMTMSLPPSTQLRTLSTEAAAPGRAWLNQLAVDPTERGTGLARRLRDEGLTWARAAGASVVGVDTAEPATSLVDTYRRWGFVQREVIQWPGKTYRSVVMTSPLDGPFVSRP